MSVIYRESLAATLDAVNEAFFYGQTLSTAEREEAARWIAELQGQGNKSYSGFPPSPGALNGGARLFTGERLRTRFPGVDVIGVEACRALVLLDGHHPDVQKALARADAGLKEACFVGPCITGECAYGAVAMWRYLAVGGFEDVGRRLESYLRALATHRDGKGRWKQFPFYYTLLALSELDHPLAHTEKQYAAPACERMLRRTAQDDPIIQRRRALMARVLDQC